MASGGYGKYIKIIYPTSIVKVHKSATLTIRWESGIHISTFNIQYRKNPSDNWNTIANDVTGNSYLWRLYDFTLEPSRQYQIRVYREIDGVIYEAISPAFTIYAGSLIPLGYPYILHGYGKPYFVMRDLDGNILKEVELRYPVAMVEKWTPEIIVHKLWNGKKRVIAKGWWYECVLDFSNYSTSKDIADILPLYDFANRDLTGSREILFYPRGNIIENGGNFNYFYKVEISENSVLELQMLPHRSGYRNLKLELKGIERLSQPFDDITLFNTEEMSRALPYGIESGYGTNYGEEYG